MDIFEFGGASKSKGKEKLASSSNRLVIVNKKAKKGKKSGEGTVLKRKISSQQKKILQNAQEQALRLKLAKRKVLRNIRRNYFLEVSFDTVVVEHRTGNDDITCCNFIKLYCTPTLFSDLGKSENCSHIVVNKLNIIKQYVGSRGAT